MHISIAGAMEAASPPAGPRLERRVLALVVAVVASCFGRSCAELAGSKPHILHIVLDDLGWSEVGWHSTTGEVPTPHLSSLLQHGVELERHYAHKICSPSRCAVQTGRAPIHVNVQNLAPEVHNPEDPVGGFQGIPVNMTGVAQHLKGAGYRTALVGKWDVGMATAAHAPHARGFDSWLGYWHHANDYWTFAEGACEGSKVRDLWRSNTDLGVDEPATELQNPETCSQQHQGGCVYEEELLTDEVVRLINAANASTDPLFLFWSTHLVHFPLQAPRSYLEGFHFVDNDLRRHMAAMVSYLDDAIGRVVASLHQAGLWEKTVIVAHSDNGGEIMFGGTCAGNNYPLRGGKFSNFEGGIRTVALMSGGALPTSLRGTRSDALVTAWDWYSTYAMLAGVDPWDHAAEAAGLPPIDSISILPVLEGQDRLAGAVRHEVAIGDTAALRYNGDGQTLVGGLIWQRHGKLYKLLIGAANKDFVVLQDVQTGPLYPNNSFGVNGTPPIFSQLYGRRCDRSLRHGCLFELVSDPTEQTSLAEEDPVLFRAMLRRVDELQLTVFSPDRGSTDPGACEKAMGDYGGYWGPWL